MAETLTQTGSATVAAGDHDASNPNRRDFIYILTGAAAIGGAAAVAWPLIDQMNPAADTLALASLEYDLSKVVVGQEVTIAWRKQPVFIRHRTPKEIAEARAADNGPLKDPQKDAARVKTRPRGVADPAGELHPPRLRADLRPGRVRRLALPLPRLGVRHLGRIRKGPAPKNLGVPDYAFLSPTKVKIG